MASGFKIGSTLVGLAALESVLTATEPGGIVPWPFAFQAYTEIVGKDLAALPIKKGLPTAKWHFEWMLRADLGTLRTYEGVCYIATDENDGTFGNYKVVMSIPEEPEPMDGGRVGPVDVEYANMEIQS